MEERILMRLLLKQDHLQLLIIVNLALNCLIISWV